MRPIRLTLAGCIVVLVVGCGQPGVVHRRAEDSLYVNPVFPWSISYPLSWRLDRDDPTFVKITGPLGAPGTRQGLVGIHSRSPLGPGISSADELADAWLAAARSARPGQRFEMLSRERRALPDGTSVVEVINLLGAGVVGKSCKRFLVVNGQGFLLDAETYLDAWDELEADFERIIASFTIRRVN